VLEYRPGRRRCRTWEGASATKGASPSVDLSGTGCARAGELLPHRLEVPVIAAPGREGEHPGEGEGRRDRRGETLLLLVLVLEGGRASQSTLKFKLTQNHIALKLKFKVT
jgi:hypothetical protein